MKKFSLCIIRYYVLLILCIALPYYTLYNRHFIHLRDRNKSIIIRMNLPTQHISEYTEFSTFSEIFSAGNG